MSAATAEPLPDLNNVPTARGGMLERSLVITALVLLLTTAAAGFAGSRPAAFAFLTAWVFGVSLAVGALFWVMLHHVVDAGWSVVVRRPLEQLALTVVPLAAFGVLVALLVPTIYEWTGDDPALAAKRWWLNRPFWTVRLFIYLSMWSWMAVRLWSFSRQQDDTDSTTPTDSARFHSPSGLFILAFTTTLAAFDWIMSLDYRWTSTMMGVMFWSGAILGSLAAWILAVLNVQRAGYLRRTVTAEHLNDFGKYLLGFTIFWAYIAFSQYFLIWYANLAEETPWYLRRLQGDWRGVAYALAFGQFVIPFMLLMSRAAKRSAGRLGFVAGWVLFFHYVDLHFQIVPERGGAALSVWDVLAGVGVILLAAAVTVWGVRRSPLVPVNDVRLGESLRFQNVE